MTGFFHSNIKVHVVENMLLFETAKRKSRNRDFLL